MLLDDLPGYARPRAGAACFGRVEWLEYLIQDLCRNTQPCREYYAHMCGIGRLGAEVSASPVRHGPRHSGSDFPRPGASGAIQLTGGGRLQTGLDVMPAISLIGGKVEICCRRALRSVGLRVGARRPA